MNSVRSVWLALDPRKRLIAGLVAAFVFVMILTIGFTRSDKNLALLYAGLDGRAAGDVVKSLEQRNIAFEVRGSGIFVEAAVRDSLRMALAGEGLPSSGAQGYELLDELSGFGTTAQMFDAAYWRAKEGELARTIVSSPHFSAARVHISAPPSRPFQARQNASAAVTVTTAFGSVSPENVRALRFLVASAIPDLTPSDVAVIDDKGGLIASGPDNDPIETTEHRSTVLKSKVERLLERQVGAGNAIVEVALETVTERESLVERRIDPESRVAISTENTERTRTADGADSGQVTVASNLPDGEGATGNSSSEKSSETNARTNFEISEIQREVERIPGAIKRLSVAVLVNNRQIEQPDGSKSTEPRSEEELTALKELVSSAVGIDTARGDILTLRSLPFEGPTISGSEPTPPVNFMERLDVMQLATLGLVALIVALTGIFVVRPIMLAQPTPQLMSDDAKLISPAPTSDGKPLEATQNVLDNTAEDPIERLKSLIDDRKEESMELLQSWIDPDDQPERTA